MGGTRGCSGRIGAEASQGPFRSAHTWVLKCQFITSFSRNRRAALAEIIERASARDIEHRDPVTVDFDSV